MIRHQRHPGCGTVDGGSERFDIVPQKNRIETRFDHEGAGTLMTMRMTLPDSQTRASMLASGMESGMETSYARLENMI